MQITFTWQGLITAFAVVGAVVGLVAYFAKVVRWVDKQNEQDEEIKRLKQHHEDDIKSLKEEQALLIEGVLACLMGLQEQGCNGSVTKAIKKYNTYLNEKAHQ
jgi:Na+/melibiose symporter-like transporter